MTKGPISVGYLLLLAYIGTILVANWLLVTFGLVPVGFGLVAPAGVYAAGLAFTFRDLTQDVWGRRVVFWAIVAGALLSLCLSPQFALASAVAFAASELLDWAVYTPLRRRRWLLAVAASNVVGLAVDSALFLSIAFQSLDYLSGQVVAKTYMTIAAVVVLWIIRKTREDWPHARTVSA